MPLCIQRLRKGVKRRDGERSRQMVTVLLRNLGNYVSGHATWKVAVLYGKLLYLCILANNWSDPETKAL